MFSIFKRLLIGKALKTEELSHEKYNVFWGLPVLSSDAISSVAYAGEEILWVLIPIIGLMAYKYMFYAALAIVLLLFILVFSYRQTIDSYPCGGGSYIVAKDNLGTIPGLMAGASLSIDYILTVAVSCSAGTAAITSAIPSLLHHKVIITLFLIAFMTIGNLRGMRESSRLFGIPTYLFIFSILALIATGMFKMYILGYQPAAIGEMPKAAGDITIFLFLRAFASGCTALTGVEAVSNGIPNFRDPAQKNAKSVLMLLALFVLVIFGGTSFLATKYQVVPSLDKTVISQISYQVFGNTFMFYMLQVTTALILTMAANTAFSDLPLLMSLISRDSYAPRQFARRGKRLSFSNGIILLAIAASLLIIIFKGETHFLLPLYAVGVFISFTLSQTGMFMKWLREKTPGWRHKAVINGFGAIITFATVIIIGITRFKHGAWIVCILIPILVILMLITKNHYMKVAEQLALSKDEVEKEIEAVDDSDHIIVLIDSLNKASFKAINYARHISNNYKTIVAFNSSINEDAAGKLKSKWEECNMDIPLIIKNSPYRDIMEPLIDFIESEEHESSPEDIITVVMPQFVVKHWWDNIFHGQSAMFIRQRLIHDRHIAIITVPYVLD
jgi:amino acid transporter